MPAPYNAANSAGSNLGPTAKALVDRVKDDVDKLKAENPGAPSRPIWSPPRPAASTPTSRRRRRCSRCRAWPRRAVCRRSACGAGHAAHRGPRCSACSASRGSTCWRSTWRWTRRPSRRLRYDRIRVTARPLAGSPAEGQPPARIRSRAAEDLLGAAPGRRQDLRDAAAAQARAARGVDVVVGVVETHGRAETEALLDGLEVLPRRKRRVQGPHARGDGPRRAARAPARSSRWSTSSPTPTRPGSRHPKRYLDVEELLDGGHRRLYHAQHPARREPQRRRRADHPHPGARDGAGLRPRPRRRDRGDRPHARRPDPAAARGQGLCAAAGRRGRSSIISRPAT